MNVNFLRKFFMLVLLVVGCAGGAWADGASSTAVAEVLDANGNKVGEYDKLPTAISVAGNASAKDKANRTIRLLTDLNYGNTLEFGGSTIGASLILDLNGHTLNMESGLYFSVKKGSKLKIIDGATGGELNLASGMLVSIPESGEIEFASGTYNFDQIGNYGTLTISGGKLNVNFSEPIKLMSDNAKVNITGGLFKECDNQKSFSKYIDAENYKTVENVGVDGYYAVAPSNVVALNFDANNVLLGTYDNFHDAMSNASDGKIVRLCANCETGSAILTNSGYGVRLDLNGYNLTNSGLMVFKGFTAISDESASQSGTIITSKEFPIHVNIDATLFIYGGNFINTSSDAIILNDGGTVNIFDGKFSYIDSWVSVASNGTTNIYGGFFNKNTSDYESYNWMTYIADGFMEIDNSGVENYPYAVVPVGANLTYGDGTTAKVPAYNGLTLDLKDDESDHNAWVSKIDVPKNTDPIDVTVKKNFANTNWHAFYVPFDINVSDNLLQNFEIAKIWDTELNLDDNSTTIEFIKLADGKIPAFTPCLIKAKATGKQEITFPNVTVYKNQTKSIDCSNVEETFTFIGVMENTKINGCYALKSETNSLVLANSENAQVTPLKFYMTVESKTPTTSIKSKKFAVRVIGDETTGISDINAGGTDAKAANATVYNVQGAAVGTSLNGLPAGLYIQNGRKVVVK